MRKKKMITKKLPHLGKPISAASRRRLYAIREVHITHFNNYAVHPSVGMTERYLMGHITFDHHAKMLNQIFLNSKMSFQ